MVWFLSVSVWVVVYDHHLTSKHRKQKWSVHYCIDYPCMVVSQPIREMNIHIATTFAFIKSIDIFFTMKGSDFKKIEFVI